MVKRTQLRFVSTAEDAQVERLAAADTSGYDVGQTDNIRLTPQGLPIDATLNDSVPPAGLAEARFVDPVTMTITITLATLAVRLVNHWMKSQEAGVQVDARTTPVTVSRLAGVPFGTLAIIHMDGTTTIHREAYDDPEDVMGALEPLFQT